ncbi:hypothetical protein BDQ17DRAFT_1436992 [Cyathus striatus]|nr:hypothetical protein BDQ17DRAFT_1436992 [Cyathus striatus]
MLCILSLLKEKMGEDVDWDWERRGSVSKARIGAFTSNHPTKESVKKAQKETDKAVYQPRTSVPTPPPYSPRIPSRSRSPRSKVEGLQNTFRSIIGSLRASTDRHFTLPSTDHVFQHSARHPELTSQKTDALQVLPTLCSKNSRTQLESSVSGRPSADGDFTLPKRRLHHHARLSESKCQKTKPFKFFHQSSSNLLTPHMSFFID